MPRRTVDTETERTIRDLRRRIGRLRRHIDGRIRRTERHGRRLLAWQTYVKRLPAVGLLGAFGAGLALSAGVVRRRLSRWVGLRLMRRAMNRFGRLAWNEIQQVWADSATEKADKNVPGADDEPA